MKKIITSILVAIIMSGSTFAQLTGIKTIPGNYASVAAAISDLNTSGAGPGGVTFNIAAGYTETFASLTAGLITTNTGSVSNPIVFQKSGSGANPLITGYAIAPGTTDYIICIGGTDYVTFNGIDLAEPTGAIEWGYAILKSPTVDGSQNITIKNCTITLNKTINTTAGIYSNNVSYTAPTLQLVVTSLSGTNSNLKIYNNTIQNTYNGIYVAGFNDTSIPYMFLDQNNEIGKDGANTITNCGGLATAGYGVYTIYQNNIKVANNIITSTGGAAGIVYGIYMTNSSNGSSDIYGNNVSIQFSGTGSVNVYGIYSDMGANGTTNTQNVYNNIVSNCTYTTMTSASLYGIYLNNVAVNAQVYNNQITNNAIGSASVTAIGRFYGIYMNKGATFPGPLDFHDNVIAGNSRTQSVQGGGLTYYLSISGTCSVMNLYNNTVNNNIAANNGGTYGMYMTMTATSVNNIYNNTLTNISKAEGTVYGIYNSSFGGTTNIYKNKMQNIEGLTATAAIYGIYISASGTICYVYNNQISDLRSLAGTNATTALAGIYASAGSPIGIYNNTVYLNGSSTGTNFGTAALYASTSAGIDVRNNILVNNSTANGTGKSVAIRFSGTALTNYFSTCNYNDFYAGTPGVNNLLFYDGTTGDQTLAALKTRVSPRETQSVSELPPFISIVAGSMNMHMQTSASFQCESGGFTVSTPVAITTDYDNNARYPNPGYPMGSFAPGAPDLGAFEFGGLSSDVTSPAISYTLLPNTALFTARTLMVTITDGSGIPVTGSGLPMLYWRINSGTYQGVQGTYVSGNTYSFVFGGGTVLNDMVSYYIVAQDKATPPNTGGYPLGGSGFTANPPACSIPTSIPSTYSVFPGISGIFHVGAGKTYTTLTNAVNDINVKVITGPVTLLLDDPNYGLETYPIILNANAGSNSTNTLTIKPNAGNTVTFSTSGLYAILNINGFSYLTIDGSNNGTNSQDLTFENANSGTTANAISFSSYNSLIPANNVTIRNCIIKCIRVDAAGGNSAIRFVSTGGGYSDIKILNNTIKSTFTAIQLYGTTTNFNHRITIANNVLGSTVDGEALSDIGVAIQYTDSTLILNNEFMGPALGSLNTGQTGVYVGAGATSTKIRGNKIHGFSRTSDDGWGVSGIWYASDNTSVTEISNNSIYDLHSPGINPGVGQNITYGIFFRTGGNVKIWHNSINLFGAYMSPAASLDASSACIAFYYQATGGGFEIKDNIFRNGSTTLGGGGSGFGKAYGLMLSVPPISFTTINNNDYFCDGSNGSVAQFYQNGTGFIIEFPTLASWQTYTGQEANSLTVNPQFTSNTNLLPTTASMPHAGSYITSVPTDITGINRTNPPDIGAYEFTTNPLITTVSATSITNNSAQLNGNANASGTIFNLFFDYGLTSSYGTTVTASPSVANGNTLTGINANLSGLSGLTTYHFRARGVTTGNLIVYGNDMTFTTAPNPPTVVTTAATAITSSGATINGTVNDNGGATTVTFEYGLTTAYGTTINGVPNIVTGMTTTPVSAVLSGLLPNTVYHYRVKGVNITGTSYGSDMIFTTTAIPALVVTNFATSVGTTTATLNGTITANNASTTVTFQWGPTIAYGNTISATPSTVNGMTATAALANLTGLTINATYHFRCVGVNIAGTTNGLDQTFTTNCLAPVITISGPAATCAGFGGYVYTTQSGNSSYTWGISTGGTITSGQGTNSITVTWNTVGSQTVSVNYNNSFGCSAPGPVAYNVTVNTTPVPTITGSPSACLQVPNVPYSTQAGMSNYTWTVSSGGTITSGQGTNAIMVTWNTTGANTVSVNYTNAAGCNALAPTVFNVTVNALPSPTIMGQNSVCANSGYVTYTTESGMSNYLWTVSAGGIISLGQGTNTVQITWITPGAQTLSVNYANVNGCSAANPTVLNVTVNSVPSAAGSITGTPTVCGGTQGVAYSCATINGAVTYIWTLPAGATIASGAGTNNITVNFAGNASSGNITVNGNNLCGNGAPSPNYPVTVTPLPDAAGTISGSSSVCQGSSGLTYSVPPVANATTYTWTVPSGVTIISGGTTNTITVNFGMNAMSGTITVSGSNSCGNGPLSPAFQVTVNPIPAAPVVTVNGYTLTSSAPSGNQWYREGTLIPGATGQTYDAMQSGWYWAVVTLSTCSSDTSNHVDVIMTGIENKPVVGMELYPVPNNGKFTVSMTSPVEQNFTISIYNVIGSKVYEETNVEVKGSIQKIIDLRPTPDGIYTVIFRSSDSRIVKKFIVNK